MLLAVLSRGFREGFPKSCGCFRVNCVLWKQVIDSHEGKNRTVEVVGLSAVAPFQELFVVASGCESRVVVVSWKCRGRKECKEVLVGDFEGDLVEENKHGDVAS